MDLKLLDLVYLNRYYNSIRLLAYHFALVTYLHIKLNRVIIFRTEKMSDQVKHLFFVNASEYLPRSNIFACDYI